MFPRRTIAACGLALLMLCAGFDIPEAVRVGTLSDDRITEASGIAASRRFDGVFWTHNDGSDGVLYAIHRDGSLIGCAKIDEKVRDWEDIATDDDGNLYVADTGNNSENRKHVVVYRVREPDPAKLKKKNPGKLEVAESWKVEFPEEPANIESLFIWKGFGYLIFKLSDGAAAEMYRFDLKDRSKTVMEKVTTLPVNLPVTAADLSADGKVLAVLTRGGLYQLEVDGDPSRAGGVRASRFPLPPVQTEGCCFAGNEILIVAESREVFSVPRTAPATQSSH